MKEMKFKTTIKCSGCLEKVSPQLNKEEGIKAWDVDLEDPQRILTVKSDTTTEEEIVAAVEEAGFEIEKVD